MMAEPIQRISFTWKISKEYMLLKYSVRMHVTKKKKSKQNITCNLGLREKSVWISEAHCTCVLLSLKCEMHLHHTFKSSKKKYHFFLIDIMFIEIAIIYAPSVLILIGRNSCDVLLFWFFFQQQSRRCRNAILVCIVYWKNFFSFHTSYF